MGDIAVVATQPDRGHHAALTIAPAEGVDAGGTAHSRAAPLGADDQRRTDGRAVLQGHGRQARPDLDAIHRSRRPDLDPGGGDGLGQGRTDAPVLQHIA
ncbi:hypothetical protein D3C85_1338760 [compost metagenome]